MNYEKLYKESRERMRDLAQTGKIGGDIVEYVFRPEDKSESSENCTINRVAEAAKDYCNSQPGWENKLDWVEEKDKEECRRDFRAGAEWMARQGESIESTVVATQDEDTCHPYLALQNFGYIPAPIFCKEGDKVIVQIRKK